MSPVAIFNRARTSGPHPILCTDTLGCVADYDLARTYVAAHGGPLEVARIDAAICYPGVPVLSDEARRMLQAQRLADGAVSAPWSGGLASIEAMAGHLGVVDELKDDDGGTARLLADAQRDDGSFAETAAGTPEWLRSDRPAAVVFLTAYVAHRLGRTGDHRAAVGRAIDFIAPYLGTSHVGYLPTYWYAASAYHSLGDLGSAEATLSYVAPEVEDLGPTALASLGCAAGWSPVANGARFRLRWRQEPDGRWASEHGPDADLVTTIEATRALATGSR